VLGRVACGRTEQWNEGHDRDRNKGGGRACEVSWVGVVCAGARSVVEDHESSTHTQHRERDAAGGADAGVAPVKSAGSGDPGPAPPVGL